MKVSKLLYFPLVLFTLTACSPTKESTDISSIQTNLTKESNTTVDTTEETVQKERINIDFLYGEWESIDEYTEDYIVIDKLNDDTIKYSDNLERKDSQELKIEEISKDSITALTKDEKTRYRFIFSKEGKLTSFFGVNGDYYADEKPENIPAGLSKPIEYEMLIKCGTEDGSDTLE